MSSDTIENKNTEYRDRRNISVMPYTRFTEPVDIVQNMVREYTNEIYGLACPLSAGWPIALSSVIGNGIPIIPFDLNIRQISWFNQTYPGIDIGQIYNEDISQPSLQLQEALATTNFLYVSNIPDWLAGKASAADTSSSEVHSKRINRFVQVATDYLASGTQNKFLMLSSVDKQFSMKLVATIERALSPRFTVDIFNPDTKSSLGRQVYPISNFVVVEVYKS